MKGFIKDYFTFSKKERSGIIIIIILIISGITVPVIYNKLVPADNGSFMVYKTAVDSLHAAIIDSQNDNKYKRRYSNSYFRKYPKNPDAKNLTPASLFPFDPNSATDEDWRKLGINSKTIKTIEKYLLKGGHFYKASDISKIYGLHEQEVNRLMPYIIIKSNAPIKEITSPKTITSTHNKNNAAPVNINTADTATFASLPGIGPAFSRRIINFRNRLGGFYSIDQIAETYGLPDSTFQKIKSKLFLKDPEVKKINVNTATIEELIAHPYIRYKIANLIIQYRKQHGSFTTISDLKNLMPIDDALLIKLGHYLNVN